MNKQQIKKRLAKILEENKHNDWAYSILEDIEELLEDLKHDLK